MVTKLLEKLLLTFLVVFTSAAGAFSQSGTRVEAQGTDSILFYNNNVKTAALSNTGSFRLGATETFQATALFQLNSASQGFLAPRMTTTDRGNIVAPATGLLIYNTSTNQFDYYDGAAWLSVFSSATGDDGDWTVSGADMYSGVSGNVGIGTSFPDAKLNVEGTWDIGISNTVTGFSAGAIGSLNTVSGNRAIAIGSSVSAGHLGTIVMGDWDGGGAASLFSSANNQFTSRFRGGYRFYTDAASTSTLGIFFTNAGSVGLGTPSPSEKLDVVGNVNYSNALKVNGSFGTAGYLLTSQAGGVNTWTDPATLSTGDGIYTGSGTLSTSSLVTHADNDVVFVLSGTGLAQFQVRGMSGFNALDVQSDGDIDLDLGTFFVDASSNNVGIGTTTPVEQIQLTGTNTAIDGSDGVSMLISNSTATTGSTASINFVTNGGASSKGKTGLIHEDTGSNGIGKLHLAATSTTTLAYKVGVADAKLTVQNDGYVGIGTTSPSVTLDVTGSANILSGSADPLVVRSSTDGFALRVKESDNGNDAVSIFGYGTRGRITMKSNGVTNINFDADGTLDSYINAGNVGIGTTTPGTLLDIEVPASNAANGGLDINNADATGTYDPRIRFQVNGVNTFSMGVDNNTNDNFTIASSGNLGGTPRFAITTGGNVGIGTTAPAYKLDVSGEARIGYMGSPDTIQLIPSDFIIVFGESAMHQFNENWGIGPIQGQGPQHFMAQIPIPVGYKARKVVIKTYRGDGNYPGNPHDCYIWNMKNQISQTGGPPFATASVTGDGLSIATFSEIVAHGNAYVGIEVRDIPDLPGNPVDPPQEMITGGYVLIQQIVP